MHPSVDSILRHIAAQNGVTEREVLREIQAAIDAGYASADPAVQEYWAALPFPQKPTPQELIVYLGEQARRGTLH